MSMEKLSGQSNLTPAALWDSFFLMSFSPNQSSNSFYSNFIVSENGEGDEKQCFVRTEDVM